ncbi:cell-envelope stress modulator CpxP [Cronobacter sakazakii]
MRKVTAAVMASTLAVGALTSQAASVPTDESWHPADMLTQRNSVQSHMFDGINLTEHQRQQMRDLMQRARHEQLPVNVSEMEAMHRLVTAENFDENAVRAQAEKMAQEQVARQVEMAKVRNQMYRLLTPEQQAVLNKKHQQRMEQFREVAQMQRQSALPLLSSSTRSSNQ